MQKIDKVQTTLDKVQNETRSIGEAIEIWIDLLKFIEKKTIYGDDIISFFSEFIVTEVKI